MFSMQDRFQAVGQTVTEVREDGPEQDEYDNAMEDGRAKLESGEWTKFRVDKFYVAS